MTSLGEDMCDHDAVWPREEKKAEALSQEEPQICIQGPGFFPEGPSATECFERRAQEIARAAEAARRFAIDTAGLFSPIQPRLTEIGNGAPVPGPSPGELAGRHRRRARVTHQPWTLSPETRDSVPFGLKRRVPVGIPILHAEDRRRAAGLAVPGHERREVGLDHRARGDGQEVSIGRLRGGVWQGAGGDRDFRLREEAQLRQIRRAIQQVALDLLAEMMEIDAGLQEALAAHADGRR